jgi:hypothetical protein
MDVHYRTDSTVITSQADSGQYLVKLAAATAAAATAVVVIVVVSSSS